MVRLRREAHFSGVWIRPRGQMPVSFSDQALQRFANETHTEPVTRALLRDDPQQYARYLAWWETKRREFLTATRDYLRKHGIRDAFVLFTGCAGEPGVPFHSWEPRLVTDQPDLWRPILQQPKQATDKGNPTVPITIEKVVADDLYWQALTSPGLTWGDWEVQHSRPADDPQNYQQTPGVFLTHAFNRNYTVASPKTLAAYRTCDGLAIVRHYALNENMMFGDHDQELLGYFVADVERTGPYCMMGEALAMAQGDPTMIGYLVGSNFGRGFPQYVRNFNANFLALPAVPSKVVPHGASDDEVVVRQIDVPQHGTWLAVINTSLHPKANVTVHVPPGQLTDAVTGQSIEASQDGFTLDMYPCQLRSLHIMMNTSSPRRGE